MRKLAVCVLALVASASALAYEKPTMGWSSWNTYRVNISEEIICRQADALTQNGLKEAGYSYVNIDDGFFGGRSADGTLLIHPERFPNGLKPVVDYIHSLGFKAGIYSDAGRNTCGNFWDNDKIAEGVGFYGHDDADAKLYFSDLGFDFIKIDFCGGDSNQNSEHLDLDERERYTAIRKAIDGVGREDVRVNVCRWAFPGTWVHEVGSSWRISPDISANWNSVKSIIDANRYLSAYAGEGHFNDMDMLEIGRGLSVAEERTHFGMWCILSSPLLIGCDLTTIPARSLNLITNPEVIALNQDELGLQAYQVAKPGDVQLFVKDIEELHGTVRAVALYNPTERTINVTLNPAEVDLAGTVRVRDLYAREDMPEIAAGESITLTMRAHDTTLLRLEADERLERTVYEAETAWLERFQNIGLASSQGYAKYSTQTDCSGGAKVDWLGNHADNWMEWRDVWSRDGGVYDLTIDYVQWDNRYVELTVNGGEAQTVDLPAVEAQSNKLRSKTVKVVLAPGVNTVRIDNSKAWAPDIDRITLVKDSEASMNQLSQTSKRPKVSKISTSTGVISVPAGESVSVWGIDGRCYATASAGDVMVSPGVYFLIRK